MRAQRVWSVALAQTARNYVQRESTHEIILVKLSVGLVKLLPLELERYVHASSLTGEYSINSCGNLAFSCTGCKELKDRMNNNK